jgi:hypothetical protein
VAVAYCILLYLTGQPNRGSGAPTGLYKKISMNLLRKGRDSTRFYSKGETGNVCSSERGYSL